MAGPAYVTRETVMNVGGYGSVIADRIDRAIFSRSRTIEDDLHRHFYPVKAAYTYTEHDESWWVSDAAFWLNRDLQSVSAITVDGSAPTTYVLLPKDGPPYNRISVDSYWNVDTIITGVWGWSNDTAAAGTLAAAVVSEAATTIDVTDSYLVGVGDLITIDAERLIVTDKTAIDSTANLDGALTAAANNQTVTLTDATGFVAGEEILVESERMLIQDVTGNDLSVERAYRGSTLAAHDTAKDVYLYRRLTVERGATGTTATTHLISAAITRNVPPPQIRDWCLAEVLTQLEQEGAAYARVVGSGETQREARGAGLTDARYQARRLARVRIEAV